MSGIVKLSLNVFGYGVCELPTSTVLLFMVVLIWAHVAKRLEEKNKNEHYCSSGHSMF